MPKEGLYLTNEWNYKKKWKGLNIEIKQKKVSKIFVTEMFVRAMQSNQFKCCYNVPLTLKTYHLCAVYVLFPNLQVGSYDFIELGDQE